jgi:signal peptidase I
MSAEQPSQFQLQPVKDNNEKPDVAHTVKSVISNILIFLVTPLLIAYFLTSFVIQSYQVDGESMETTLQNHDRLIVDKLPRTWAKLTGHQYVPKRGDIIIFNQTGLSDSYYQKQLIKRVVGLPGEKVSISNGTITIYNKAHPEGFNPDTAGKYHIAAPSNSGELQVTLGPNEVFVCGDNRNNSEDSRIFGPVNTKTIVGKLSVRIFPFNKSETF